MSEIRATRKIQLTGGSTYIVSLPKEWVKYFGLKAGDEVEISTDGYMRLVVEPKGRGIADRKVVPEIECSKSSLSMIVRDVISYYVAGADGVTIRSHCMSSEERESIKGEVRSRLLGAEVIDESSESLTFNFIVSYKDLGIKTAITRAYSISLNMLKDDMNAISQRRPEVALDVKFRDDEVDRFYFYVVRLLSQGVVTLELLKQDGFNVAQTINLYNIIKSVERISDHAARISNYLNDLLVDDMPKSLVDFGYFTVSMFSDAMSSFFNYKKELAEKVIESSSNIRETYSNILATLAERTMRPKAFIAASLTLDSFMRISRYAMDVAESVIDILAKQNVSQI